MFKNLEETSSRNDMIDILAKLFKKATEENVDKICYFVLGSIAAGYKDVKMGMGDEMVKSAIAFAADMDENEVEKEMRQVGDFGDVAYKLIGKKEKRFEDFLKTEDQPTIEDVHKGLMKIAKAEGSGSIEVKEKTLAALLSTASPEERMYIVRLAAGEMRLGVGDMTVLEVLASEITESPTHTCNWNDEEKRGLALRFPRFERWRPEKSPEQTTTVQEIADMLADQRQK